jgi:hypothetical protein
VQQSPGDPWQVQPNMKQEKQQQQQPVDVIELDDDDDDAFWNAMSIKSECF